MLMPTLHSMSYKKFRKLVRKKEKKEPMSFEPSLEEIAVENNSKRKVLKLVKEFQDLMHEDRNLEFNTLSCTEYRNSKDNNSGNVYDLISLQVHVRIRQ